MRRHVSFTLQPLRGHASRAHVSAGSCNAKFDTLEHGRSAVRRSPRCHGHRMRPQYRAGITVCTALEVGPVSGSSCWHSANSPHGTRSDPRPCVSRGSYVDSIVAAASVDGAMFAAKIVHGSPRPSLIPAGMPVSVLRKAEEHFRRIAFALAATFATYPELTIGARGRRSSWRHLSSFEDSQWDRYGVICHRLLEPKMLKYVEGA